MKKPKPLNAPSLIGVIHLPALPTTAHYDGRGLRKIALQAIEEAKLFEAAGFHAVILENFGDVPFEKVKVSREVFLAMGLVASAVRSSTELLIGINVLRNAASDALKIAHFTGCDFIRVNVLAGVVATDQGLIEGEAASLLKLRRRLRAKVAILADVRVKHARTLSKTTITQETEDLLKRSGADGVIVSGTGTGKSVSMARLKKVATVATACGSPCYVGSGATLETLPAILKVCHGVIVSSSLRAGSKPGALLRVKKVKQFAKTYRRLKKSAKLKAG